MFRSWCFKSVSEAYAIKFLCGLIYQTQRTRPPSANLSFVIFICVILFGAPQCSAPLLCHDTLPLPTVIFSSVFYALITLFMFSSPVKNSPAAVMPCIYVNIYLYIIVFVCVCVCVFLA